MTAVDTVTQNQETVISRTRIYQEFIVSVDCQRHSWRTPCMETRLRICVGENRVGQTEQLRVNCLAVYRDSTPHVSLCVVVSVYTMHNNIITQI